MFESLYDTLGVDAGYVAMCVPAVIVAVNFLKDVVELKGRKQLLIGAGILSAGFGLNALPDPLGLFFTSLAIWVGAVGVWKTGKKLAHKMGTPSTSDLGDPGELEKKWFKEMDKANKEKSEQ